MKECVAESGGSKSPMSPRQEVATTLDALVDAVEKNSGDEKKTIRRQKLREIISPRFDFEEMAKRSLGAHWNVATEDEQKAFVKVFSDLLATTYLNRIETIERGMVKVVSEDIAKSEESGVEKALVRTEVTSKGSTFPIIYRLIPRDGVWKVYDVNIENIGLVANYRNEFAGVIRKDKLVGLIKKLEAKNAVSR
jgi:phospholipid transport system substrate-binding protein